MLETQAPGGAGRVPAPNPARVPIRLEGVAVDGRGGPDPRRAWTCVLEPAHRARGARAQRQRQVDAGRPAARTAHARRGSGAGGRGRPGRRRPRRLAAPHRLGAAASDVGARHGRRQHPAGSALRDPGTGRGSRRGGRARHPARHPGRRGRERAVHRPAASRRARQRRARRPAPPAARRAHRRRRRRHRSGDHRALYPRSRRDARSCWSATGRSSSPCATGVVDLPHRVSSGRPSRIREPPPPRRPTGSRSPVTPARPAPPAPATAVTGERCAGRCRRTRPARAARARRRCSARRAGRAASRSPPPRPG